MVGTAESGDPRGTVAVLGVFSVCNHSWYIYCVVLDGVCVVDEISRNFILKTFSMCVQRTYLQRIFYIVVYSYFFPSKKKNKYQKHPTRFRMGHSSVVASSTRINHLLNFR